MKLSSQMIQFVVQYHTLDNNYHHTYQHTTPILSYKSIIC